MTAPNLIPQGFPLVIIPPRRLVIPRMTIRPRLAPKPIAKARLEAQHMHFQLINPGGKVAQEGEVHNLILSQTGDLLAQYSFQDLVAYAIVSTDSTTPDASDTSIPSEVARTNTVIGSDTLTRTSDGVYVYTVTREFSASQVGNENLTKWGFSPTSDGSPISEGLFGETITPDGTQKLRLIYAIKITLSPVTATDFTAFTITGWNNGDPVTGQMCLNKVGGNSLYYSANADLNAFNCFVTGTDPNIYDNDVVPVAFVGTGSDALTPTYTTSGYPASADDVAAVTTLDDYVTGSNQRTAKLTLGTNKANAQIVGMSMGYTGNVQGLGLEPNHGGVTFAFDSDTWDTKDDLHTLELDGFGWSWTVG